MRLAAHDEWSQLHSFGPERHDIKHEVVIILVFRCIGINIPDLFRLRWLIGVLEHSAHLVIAVGKDEKIGDRHSKHFDSREVIG